MFLYLGLLAQPAVVKMGKKGMTGCIYHNMALVAVSYFFVRITAVALVEVVALI